MKINLSLIGDQRYYGEAPVRLRRGPQDGLAQVGRNRGPEAKLTLLG